MKSRATVRFVLDDAIVELSDVPATMTVLEYLREVRGRTGTKEGCAEGDCGACTVVLGELAPDRSRIDYRAINSCIRFLPTIDGKELVTVENLQESGATPECAGQDAPMQRAHGRAGAARERMDAHELQLHPVQQAMVDRHGSQCGFCTPGFVMSLFGLYLNNAAPTRDDVVTALSGNLCRCTGYQPIIAAGCSMADYPQPRKWSREDAQSAVRIERLRQVQSQTALASPGFHAPTTLDELTTRLDAEPKSLLLAGGTDVGLWVTKQLRDLPPIVYLGSVAELQEIRENADGVSIGAAVSLTDAWRVIVALYPQLQELALRFASPPVCNSGTLCGNIANGSPIGDSMPILMALGAEIELRRGKQQRKLPLDTFYLGYQRKDLQPGEFVAAVTVPSPTAGQYVASYKVSKRFDQDISSVCAGFAVRLEGQRVVAARLAYGGMAAIPARAHRAEAALLNRQWQPQTIETAVRALGEDFQPLSDLRASSEYRALSAAQLLRRFYRETRGQTVMSLRELAPVASSP